MRAHERRDDGERTFLKLSEYSDQEIDMNAASSTGSVYRITELIGTSTNSWEEAATNAIETALATLRDIRIAEVTKLDVAIEDGKISAFRARVNVSFKYEK
jgi:flavin-binding protein dodecin